MNDIFQLEIFDEATIEEIMDMDSFKRFNESLDIIDELCNPSWYLEAMVNPQVEKRKNKRRMDSLTRKGWKDAKKGFQGAVDITAAATKTQWNLFFKLWGVVGNVLSFLGGGINKLNSAIDNVSDRLAAFPKELLAKIRGDIKIYIVPEDISDIYSSGLIAQMKTYSSILSRLVQGNGWGTLFHKVRKGPDTSGIKNNGSVGRALAKLSLERVFGTNDMKLINRLNKEAVKIHDIEMNTTMVQMTPETIDKYFQNQSVVSFTNLNGESKVCSYLDALKSLIEDINASSDNIKSLQKEFGRKLDKTMLEGSFAELNGEAQLKLQNVIKDTSNLLGSIGKIVKCAAADVNTINSAAKSIAQAAAKQQQRTQQQQTT